ncbi:MAG: DUF4124 domain-containing protein [Aeromonadaceae bacterium]
MRTSIGITLASAVLLSTLLPPSQAQEVYRWNDVNGIVHYSQLPPADGEAFAKVDPTVAKNAAGAQVEVEEIQANLLAGRGLPATAAGGNKPSCSPLQQDEISYRERKIEEMYVASRNNCDVIFASVSDASKRSSCYDNVAAERSRRYENMPLFPECSR